MTRYHSPLAGPDLVEEKHGAIMNEVKGAGWGPWTLNVGVYTLEHDDYEVDLEQCTTSAEVLDWIAQVATKPWATDEVIAGLVRALNDVLAPQEHLCSSGQHLRLSGKELKRLVETARF